MTCPVCGGDTKIVDSRKKDDHVMRFRKCKDCGHKFPTVEMDEDIFTRQKEAKHD